MASLSLDRGRLMAHICVVRQGYAFNDPRVRRELRALLDAGHSVDVICTRGETEAAPDRDPNDRLTVHRLPMTHRRTGVARYLFEYIAFPLMATACLIWLDRRRRFDVIQVNTLPDWLVFAAGGPRLRGVPVLLDLQECMPEFFATKFHTSPDHPGVRLLEFAERMSLRFASAAITCTREMRDTFVARGTPSHRIGVVMNGADESTFDPARYPPRDRQEGRFSLIHHGTIVEHAGLDTIIRAVDRLRGRIPGLTLEVYGDGAYQAELQRMVDELELHRQVTFHGFVQIEDLVAAIAEADAGVVAMKRDAFRDLTLCNKMFDLITMQRPVICSRTKSTMACFPNGSLKYFESGDDADLARAIEELYADPGQSHKLVQSATERNEPYRWPHQRERYMAVIDGLLEARPR